MDPSIYVSPPAVSLPPTAAESGPPQPDQADLLRQLLDVQREQLALQKSQIAAQDAGSRWRAFLQRWQSDFPGVGHDCKDVLPIIERAYLTLIGEITERLKDEPDALDHEFGVSEFLDKYGVRLGQLGNVLGQLGPLADAAPADNSGS